MLFSLQEIKETFEMCFLSMKINNKKKKISTSPFYQIKNEITTENTMLKLGTCKTRVNNNIR